MYISTHEIQNKRTLIGYKKILKIKSRSTQKIFQTTINNIKQFGQIDIENLQKYQEDDIYEFLQEWVIWNKDRGITTSSIMCYLNAFRSYLWYRRIRLDWQDIQHNIIFPQKLYENKIPLTPKIIQQILKESNLEFRFQLLALISSGLRVRELGQITLEYMDLTHSNIMVRIPAQITKTGRSRIAFFSKQVSDMIRYRIKNKTEFAFCGSRTPEQSANLILKRFAVARKKSGLVKKHNHCKQNRYIIHVHSLRSYFITRTNKMQFGLGHILAGHYFYMKEYNQYTDMELLNMYKKVEKNLTF